MMKYPWGMSTVLVRSIESLTAHEFAALLLCSGHAKYATLCLNAPLTGQDLINCNESDLEKWDFLPASCPPSCPCQAAGGRRSSSLLESACGEEPAWLAEAQEELAVSSIAVAVEDELEATALESTEEPDWLAAAQEELVVIGSTLIVKKQQQHDVEKQLKSALSAC